mmetsp:Transcript_24118/g.38621  ORF Transcript_24118/g.38621 Transcript_24118/m.38621 type:complete len:256 (+) Transcript_24118:1637-2404(+)
MQLPRLHQLTRASQGREHPPQMRQRGHESHTIESLRNTAPDRFAGFVHTPVPSGKLVLHAGTKARHVLDRSRDVRYFPSVQRSLEHFSDVLDGLAPQPCEGPRHQRTSQVDPLLPKVIAVILQRSAQEAQQQPIGHVAHEVGLATLDVGRPPNVRQQLLLKQFPCVLYAHISRCSHCRAALGNIVKSHLLGADWRSILNGESAGIDHAKVTHVEHYSLQDVPVCHDAHRSQHDHQRNLRAEVRTGAHQLTSAVGL